MKLIDNRSALKAKHRIETYNLGPPDHCRVTDSIGWICEYLKIKPELEFTGGDRGWVGDNLFVFLDTPEIQNEGWQAKYTIQQSIETTIGWLRENQWVFEKRQ